MCSIVRISVKVQTQDKDFFGYNSETTYKHNIAFAATGPSQITVSTQYRYIGIEKLLSTSLKPEPVMIELDRFSNNKYIVQL